MAQQKMDELTNDVNELRTFSTQATRQRVKDYLTIEIRKLETEIGQLRDEIAKEQSSPISDAPSSAASVRRYEVELTQYAFDESDRFVKLFVTLNGVQDCAEEAVTVDFTKNSFCLRVQDLNNRDYKLQTTTLVAAIDPAKSYRKIKSNMVAIYARKVAERPWGSLTQTEKLLKDMSAAELTKGIKDANSEGDDKDPSAGLMDMMKKMYDTGSPEMKQMISKAWVEGEEKKRASGGTDMGLGGGPGGMANLMGAMGGGGPGGFPGMNNI